MCQECRVQPRLRFVGSQRILEAEKCTCGEPVEGSSERFCLVVEHGLRGARCLTCGHSLKGGEDELTDADMWESSPIMVRGGKPVRLNSLAVGRVDKTVPLAPEAELPTVDEAIPDAVDSESVAVKARKRPRSP